MQNMPNKITDFDLSQTLLNLHKHACKESTADIMECSSPELRQEFTQALQTNLQHQQQIFQYMNQKGYYKPLPASSQELQSALQQLQSAQQQTGGAYPGAGAAGAGAAGAGAAGAGAAGGVAGQTGVPQPRT